MDGILYLEDGTVYYGKGFGYKGTSVGELVFNTSMTGYQEILTDPSYAGQIITMTYPLIGNYGVNASYNESSNIHAKGFIIKTVADKPSNYKSEGTLDDMLTKFKIVGIYDLDTRSITKKIRNNGTLKCVISNENLQEHELKEYLEKANNEEDWMKKVGTKFPYEIKGTGPKVALIDLGAKNNIIRNLKKRNCNIIIFPHNATYQEILGENPEGILISNGPGDPKCAIDTINTVKKLIDKLPVFGICLGHQILALAAGGDTYKMKYGHRGGNHGVIDKDENKAYITSQNHGYAVGEASLQNSDFVINIRNLNDNTIEGMKHKTLPVFSTQFHPEGAPGPEDSAYLFDKFIKWMKEGTR